VRACDQCGGELVECCPVQQYAHTRVVELAPGMVVGALLAGDPRTVVLHYAVTDGLPQDRTRMARLFLRWTGCTRRLPRGDGSVHGAVGDHPDGQMAECEQAFEVRQTASERNALIS
jgi:hypothetical protein